MQFSHRVILPLTDLPSRARGARARGARETIHQPQPSNYLLTF
jgi:hypothetical protein